MEVNKHGNKVFRLPSGRVIEYQDLPNGGARPMTVIEPDGQVYFRDDLDKMKIEAGKTKINKEKNGQSKRGSAA